MQAIGTGTFSHVRAFAFSSARAFLNDFDIMSKGGILSIGFQGFKREHNLMPLLTSDPRPITFNAHLDDNCPDILAQGPDL